MRYLVLFLFVVCNINVSFGQWENLNTGINDNLTGVVFLQNNGLACGEHGIYITTTGGVGAGSWTRFQITNNATNADIYENTKFTHCFTKISNSTDTGYVYVCGQDNVTHKAILLSIALPTLTYQFRYIGAADTKLNKIDYSSSYARYIAVGDGGLMLSFSDSTSLVTLTSGTTDDLTAIHCNNGVLVHYGSAGKIRRGQIISNAIYPDNLVVASTPATPKDICVPYAVGGDYFLNMNLSSSPLLTRNTYYTAPLNANSVLLSGTYVFVGTDQGIYRCAHDVANFTTLPLEWQPSSNNFAINMFWKQTSGTYTYAAGNNGVILRTYNNGGGTKPYLTMSTVGGCYPATTAFTAVTGSATTANWYANNQLFHTGLGNFSYTFPAAGTYNISVVTQNSSGEQSTASQTLYLVNPPNINKVVTLNDYILCHQETVQVQIANAEPNVTYTLMKEGQYDVNYGQSPAATGGNLVFTSLPIDVTGNYYIYANSSLVDCGQRFTGNFLITVEETKAFFQADLINANPNEVVHFYQQTTDAAHYNWQFAPNASTVTATLPNPQTSFASLGATTVVLDAASDNGCHDVLTTNGPYIYPVAEETHGGECYQLINHGPDPQWPGHFNPYVSEIAPVADGFISCGAYTGDTFDSKFGRTKDMSGKRGGYLAKYTKNGTLRWMVYTIQTPVYDNSNENIFHSCTADADGNIYLCGRGSGYFYDNAGAVINLAVAPYWSSARYFIIKLNANGQLLWYLQNNILEFTKVAVDHENNPVVLSSQYGITVPLYLNGNFTQPIAQTGLTTTTPSSNFAILKLSPQGALLWDANVYIQAANEKGIMDLGFDSSNNIYMYALYDMQINLYSTGSTVAHNIPGDGAWGSKVCLFKYNKDGQFQWLQRSRTTTADMYTDVTTARDMTVTDDGTVYLTGSNFNNSYTNQTTASQHVFENTDGSVTATHLGKYYTAKINADGVCQWLRGAGMTYYGEGVQVTVSGNEVYAIGRIGDNYSQPSSLTQFDSTDGNGYGLTMTDGSDYFMTVYDLEGNLKRIVKNGLNTGGVLMYWGTTGFNGFFKDGNHFYLAKNIRYYNFPTTPYYSDWGVVLPDMDEIEANITRFTEQCGVIAYDATLGTATTPSANAFTLVPNPTTGAFSIDLKTDYVSVQMALYDITGKCIAKETFANTHAVNTTVNGAKGIYFVQLKADNKEQWFKLIKS